MEVKLVNLTKVFSKKEGDVVAVDHINIDIPSGKLVGLLGPSGCGKSTTLYMIAGLHRPTEGQIFFGENEVSKYPPEKRGIGLVFQNYALYPHLTVEQNIMFPLENQKMKKAEAKEKAYEYAKIVGIEGLLNRKPGQLSGGQQQRVAIARALVKQPDVLLLDEPLSNLDARLRLQTREEIKRIQRETGVTTIFVTHDQEEAMSISDEIVVMNFGVVHQIGIPQEVYNEPVDMFVAKFLGTPPINIFDGIFDGRSTRLYGQTMKLAYDRSKLLESGKTFKGLIPETMKITENGPYEVIVDKVENFTEEIKAEVNTEVAVEEGKEEVVVEEQDPITEDIKKMKLYFHRDGHEEIYSANFPCDDSIKVGDTIHLSFKTEVNVGVRPENIVVDPKGPISVYVDQVEYIGRDKTMIFKFDKESTKTFKAIIPSDLDIHAGDTVNINFKRFFIFDKEGARLI